MKTRIIIADDHPLFRNALVQAVSQVIDNAEIFETDSITGLEQLLTRTPDADLILLDLRMPGANGFSGLVLIRREHADIPVIVISASEDATIMQRAIDYGAAGFIPKSATLEQIAAGINSVMHGNVWLPLDLASAHSSNPEEHAFAQRLKTLTPQQLRVFMMLTKGLLNKQIAGEVNVSEATVRTHMTAIFRKLGVRNRTQAVLAANYLNLDEDN